MEGEVGNQTTLFRLMFQLKSGEAYLVYIDRTTYRPQGVTVVKSCVLAVFIEPDNVNYMILHKRVLSSGLKTVVIYKKNFK